MTIVLEEYDDDDDDDDDEDEMMMWIMIMTIVLEEYDDDDDDDDDDDVDYDEDNDEDNNDKDDDNGVFFYLTCLSSISIIASKIASNARRKARVKTKANPIRAITAFLFFVRSIFILPQGIRAEKLGPELLGRTGKG